MIAYWTRFAATGKPSTVQGSSSFWPRYRGLRPQIQELVPGATAPESAAQFAAAHQCGLWAAIGTGAT